MFERLRIKDIQAHESQDIDLAQPVTVIAGPSDVGKSSVLRSLRWVCQNKPSGDGLRRDGAANCKAGLSVDGHKLIRAKGKSGNTYILDGQTFAAVGTGIPEPVAGLLRLDDVNFQGQLDAPFWFSLTPGQVSKELNRIVNLDAIDRVMGELLSRKRKAATAEEVAADRLQQSNAKLERLSFAEQVETDLRRVQDLEEAAEKTRRRADGLRSLGDDIAASAQKKKRLTKASKAVDRLHVLRDKANESAGAAESLEQLIKDAEHIQTKIDTALGSLSNVRSEIDKLTEGKCPVCGGELNA